MAHMAFICGGSLAISSFSDTAGVAHVIAVVLSAIRLAQLTSRRNIRLKLTGRAQGVHIFAAVLSCIALLLVVFQLQVRVESSWL